MPRESTHSQPTLLPPEALECVLRIGVVGAAGHAQVQVEIRNATDGELLAMESTPHVEIPQLTVVAEAALRRLLEQVRVLSSPF